MNDSIQSNNKGNDLPDKQHVFIIGAKSLGAYGGYETFVNKLTEYHQDNSDIQYHIACKANGDGSRPLMQLDGALPLTYDSKRRSNQRLLSWSRMFLSKSPAGRSGSGNLL